jgi:hypothetical protein
MTNAEGFSQSPYIRINLYVTKFRHCERSEAIQQSTNQQYVIANAVKQSSSRQINDFWIVRKLTMTNVVVIAYPRRDDTLLTV